MDNITLYSADGCPFCIKAKLFLKEKHIGFSEILVRPGSKELKEMQEKTGSDLLPQILIDGEPAGGYDELVNLFTAWKLGEKPGLSDEISSSLIYDVLIIGGGPAGLNAALYTSRKVLKTILISYNIGGQVADTYDIENYLGFSQIETADLIRKFDEHVEKFGIEKFLGTKVTSLDLTGKIKKITTGDGKTYYSRTVIIATGKRPRPLNAPGEKELVGRGVAYCSTCDAPLFAGADVAVIGGGNSALEAVIDLAKVAEKIFMVSLTPLTGDPILINKVSSLSKVSIFTKHDTTRVIGDSNVKEIEIKSLDTGEVNRLKVEGVFIEIGLLPNSDIIIDTLETNQQGEIIIDNVCRTGITGVFACGDVTSIPYKQVIIAAGEGAKAALSAYDYLNKQR